jgi:dihydrofolate reductase
MLKIIAAVSDNGIIGRNGEIPWRLPDDLKWFKRVTGSSPVVMGRKTYESLPSRFKPLPGRENIILSRHQYTDLPVTPSSFVDVIVRSAQEDIFVIGGAEPYEMALPEADEMYLTRVHTTVEGDVFFPEWNPSEWQLVWAQDNKADAHNEFDFTQELYRRKYPARHTEHPYIEMRSVRTDEQRQTMEKILEAGHCPFCPENLHLWHKPRILREGEHWLVTYNQWPYPNSEVHLLILLKTHAVDLSELPQGAGEEYFELIKWVEQEFGIAGGATWMRFGEPIITGASVRHLHAQIMAPHPKATEPTKIYIGSTTNP